MHAALLACALLAPGGDARYLEDFEFVVDTVAQQGAAVKVRDLDWKRAAKRFEPLFRECEDDAQHVRNVMRLLAVLHDSHSGVTDSQVGWDALPSKWDGLYGGGLWFAWDEGRLFVRGIMEGHPLAGTVPLGAALRSVDGWPTWLWLQREKRRVTKYQGASTDHSLFSSMGNRLLPFGEAQQVACVFVEPEKGKDRAATVARWGPGGKAFHPSTATLPEGVEWKEGATAMVLSTDWCARLGYVRITGSMDADTVRAFHRAFDELRDVEAVLLDCRGMGGGGDGQAWEMAGRFFPEGVDNGLHGRIEASGSWQFDGPVVMLQDEVEVSSAETFTWALSETERCVSVGRPTGGWGIIPKRFDCPSGLLSFRLGVNARPTPIGRVQTEGVGWPPDVLVPYGPVLCARPDPTRELGLEALRCLHAGCRRDDVVDAFAELVAGELKDWGRSAKALARKAEGLPSARLADLVERDLEASLAMELALLEGDDVPGDASGVFRRSPRLRERLTAAGKKALVKRLDAALVQSKAERVAQEELLELLDEDFAVEEDARESFLKRHGRSAVARFASERLWGDG